MADKSRRARSRHAARGSKRRSAPARAVNQPVAASAHQVPAPVVSTRPASVPTPVPPPASTRDPFVISELRRIGIVAGILLAILVALALVLP